MQILTMPYNTLCRSIISLIGGPKSLWHFGLLVLDPRCFDLAMCARPSTYCATDRNYDGTLTKFC